MDKQNKIPRHVAIIMDGNGRWAKSRGLPRVMGHRQGTKATREVVNLAGKWGIEFLTLYVFSSENWQRPPKEVSFLMSLLVEMLDIEIENLHKNNVKLKALGSMDRLPDAARKKLEWGIDYTSKNTGLQLNLAISYGGRQEIVNAAKQIAFQLKSGVITEDQIDETLFSNSLYLPEVPDPELMIRTGGEFRISNYLLWQAAYSEVYVSDFLWPDFNEAEFQSALQFYAARERRFGKVLEES